MEKKIIKRRWLFVLIFFCFLFIQQFESMMVDSLRTRVEGVLNVSEAISGTIRYLLIGILVISFIIWGIEFDRHSRRNLLVLGGIFWWATAWLTGLAPTYATFAVSYLGGWIDFGSVIGIFAVTADYYSPRNRAKIFGLFQAAQPLAYLIILFNFQDLFSYIDWRAYLVVSGILGLTFGLLILLLVKEPKRGMREPALLGIHVSGQYLFDWESARDIITKPSFIMLCFANFFTVLPWTAFLIWVNSLFSENIGELSNSAFPILFPILIAIVLGNALGGFISDISYVKEKRGRVIANIFVMTMALVSCVLAYLSGELTNMTAWILITLTTLLVGMGQPGIYAMLYDITLPEIRGTASSIFIIFQMAGLGLGMVLIKIMESHTDIWTILFSLTLTSILVNLLLLGGLFRRLSIEIENLRRHMAYRSKLESRLESRQ